MQNPQDASINNVQQITRLNARKAELIAEMQKIMLKKKKKLW